MFEFTKDSSLTLKRYPHFCEDSFLAWDAVDEYIINVINQDNVKYENILIIEDDFGALGSYVNAKKLYFVNDSILSHKGIKENFSCNNINDKEINFLTPYDNFPEDIDLILIKIPKTNKYFEFLLNKLTRIYQKEIPYIAASKVKYLNTTIYNNILKYSSSFQYSLSWKKAKVIKGNLTKNYLEKDFLSNYEDYGLTFSNYPNLFSSDKVDIGSRFLLDNLEFLTLPKTVNNIVDVAAGNGILGILLQKRLTNCHLWLSDISFSAYKSAEKLIELNNIPRDTISFTLDHSLVAFPDDFAELIVINPPFHNHHKISMDTALDMLFTSYRVLKRNGQLLVIANRHLGYQKHLKKYFKRVEIIRENSKFSLLMAYK